jgi:hypothetical protein
MATATGAMSKMQQQMNPAKVQATVQQFAKENAKMEMAQEMMGDTLDGALDDDETEAETGELVNQVGGLGRLVGRLEPCLLPVCCAARPAMVLAVLLDALAAEGWADDACWALHSRMCCSEAQG